MKKGGVGSGSGGGRKKKKEKVKGHKNTQNNVK